MSIGNAVNTDIFNLKITEQFKFNFKTSNSYYYYLFRETKTIFIVIFSKM